MSARTAGFVAMFVLIAGFVSAKDNRVNAVVGDTVFVRLTGEVAKIYAIELGTPLPPGKDRGLAISLPATIEQLTADGKFRIECTQTVESKKNKPRLITLTALIDPAKLTSDITLAGTAIYASPGDQQKGIKPTKTKTAERSLRLELSNLHGVRLRTWSLVNEIGGLAQPNINDVFTAPVGLTR